MSKKNLFQSVKSFINKRSVCTQFTTKELHNEMSGIESVTFWKRHGNEFYRTDTYRSYLKRLGFVKKIKNGLWEVIAPIPDWFDSGTANFLLFPAYRFENGKSIRQYHYKGEIRSVIQAKLDEHFRHYNQLKEIVMTFPAKPKYKVGDKVKIIGKTGYHGFDIGETVEVIFIKDNEEWLECRGNGGQPIKFNQSIDMIDIELIIEKPKHKVGDYVKIVKNICNHNFSIGEIVRVSSLDEKGKIYSCQKVNGLKKDSWLIAEKEVVATSEIPLGKSKPCKLNIESTPKELAKELVGDGKTPNLWFVTSGPYIMVRDEDGISEYKLLDNTEAEDSETFGPYFSYEAACEQYDALDLDPHDGIGQVFIEDRLIGTVKEKYAEKVIKIDFSFNEHDDSKLFYKK